jgi:hypothetical protein
MRTSNLVSIGIWLVLSFRGAAAQEAARAGMAVWDTGAAAAEALSPAAIAAKAGWTPVPGPAAAFKGDAVVSNGRILAVFRSQAAAVDLYSLAGDQATARARLIITTPAGDALAKGESLALADSNKSGAALALAGRTAKGVQAAARLRIARGELSIEIQPGAGAGRLRVECAGRFAVLPDFFADDILIDAAKLPGASAEIPSENILLQLADSRDAIIMTSFENREKDVRLLLTGEGAARRIAASEMEFAASKKVWVSVLAEPRIWHGVEIKPEDSKREIPLDWKMPFPASWRVDFTHTNGLADSWDMLLQHKKGHDYVKPAWPGGPAESVNDATRRRFTEVLGFFPYPAWSDPERRGYLQPLELETRTKFIPVLKYVGPAVIFPMGRVPETPPEASTVVDLMRSTLGVGPCAHILDVEGQKEQYKGIATCNAREGILEIYKKGEQKKRQAEILKMLDDTLAFVKHIRARITAYVEFGRGVRTFLAEQKKAHPELAGPIDELDKLAREIDARVEERAERIKSPADVAKMNDDFRKNVVETEGKDVTADVTAFGDALTRIGGNQDKLVSECRWVARTLRQQSALLLAGEPRLAPVAAELRARTQEVLKNPSHHERARQ